ncbi:hypothetical protein BDZ97DRAFT_1002332 [Flammula alnicola]|nr:hypothetical protein BDZ97DRAFT_1002332 [Flammula alnicola]
MVNLDGKRKREKMPVQAHARAGIILLLRAEDELVSTFSFSSSSGTLLGAGLAPTPALARATLVFCACDGVCCSAVATDDTRRCGTGVTLAGTGVLAEDDLESDETRPVGVGVPTIDGRDFTGGGPIEPSTLARPEAALVAEDAADEVPPLALMRVLFPRAETLVADADSGVSVEFFRSFLWLRLDRPWVASVPESDRTDGGLESGVALNTEESLRCAVFDGWAGVLPAVPRRPNFLLSYNAKEINICRPD